MVTSCSQNYNDSITLKKAVSSTSRRAGATEEIMGGRDASQPRKKNSVSVISLYIFRFIQPHARQSEEAWLIGISF
jgi:hypothetical protein